MQTPPTPAFLDELIDRARRFGWDGDYVEIQQFVRSVCLEGGRTVTDEELEPYPPEDD